MINAKIDSIQFYLEKTDIDFTEQPNNYGKSLLNGIDIYTTNGLFSIGNRFVDTHFGLSINVGKTSDLETLYFDNEPKEPINYLTDIVGQTIKSVIIYWLPIRFPNEKGLYPQDIEIRTEYGYFLLSSIEVTNGKVDVEFTDELLIIEDLEVTKELGLGEFGNRQVFQSLEGLIRTE
ncbi:hypothetical protein [Arcicella lustrica]|uniref:Uncharacterized protein n=1 Tax=Arcicella lustrica TaxID=2984196 RepID=A0ABU5SQZ4_9BACT|nr:hypothetical protein [Arcicella sp. DC25W]MEA5429702.1 hypothetical protein [Arcicella sp. DC25W]